MTAPASAHDGMQSAERDLHSIRAEMVALWQEYLACEDFDRRLGLLHAYARCQEDWNGVLQGYRVSLEAWRNECRVVPVPSVWDIRIGS